MDIKIVTQTDSNTRYLFHKTATSILIVTQRRDNEDYIDEKSFALPLFLVPALEVQNISIKNLPHYDDSFDSTVQIESVESTALSESIRNQFFELACQDVPLTENQMGTFSFIWTLEEDWGMPSTKPWVSPQITSETPALNSDEFSQLKTPQTSQPPFPDTPIAGQCLAPKKRELERTFSECCKGKNSLQFWKKL